MGLLKQPHTVTLQQAAEDGGTRGGRSNLTTIPDVPCFFEAMQQDHGHDVRSQAWVLTKTEMKVKDKVTYKGKTYPVFRVDEFPDNTGAFSHYEVFLGPDVR